jgi:hypothetical protein
MTFFNGSDSICVLDDDSAYWKSDGSSTATGDWDLGNFNLTAGYINNILWEVEDGIEGLIEITYTDYNDEVVNVLFGNNITINGSLEVEGTVGNSTHRYSWAELNYSYVDDDSMYLTNGTDVLFNNINVSGNITMSNDWFAIQNCGNYVLIGDKHVATC